MGTDAAVSAEVLRILRPLGIDAAVKALTAQAGEMSAAQRQLELALQQARYHAGHARQQYDAVDPANRLVTGELERRWNEALVAVQRIEGEIAAIVARKPPPMGEPERRRGKHHGAMTLAADEFIRRFLIHVLPDGFHRIRYFGLLCNRQRERKLARCRELLGMQVAEAARLQVDYRALHQSLTGMSLTLCPACGHVSRLRLAASDTWPNSFNAHSPGARPAA